MRSVRLTDLSLEIKIKPYRLVLGLGFDSRCLAIIETLIPNNSPKQIIPLLNVGFNKENSSSVTRFMQLINNEHLIIGNDCKNIIDFADNLNELITKFDPEIATVIDVTSISHELLCILIALLNQHNKLNKTVLFYTGAKQYSINTPANAMWLSKGVASIRSILGYPGTMLTSKPLHLVLMAGFEVERAFEVIRSYEPNLLSLGLGDSEHSVSKEHYENNVVFLIGYKNLSRNKN